MTSKGVIRFSFHEESDSKETHAIWEFAGSLTTLCGIDIDESDCAFATPENKVTCAACGEAYFRIVGYMKIIAPYVRKRHKKMVKNRHGWGEFIV
jgi:ribosomal protein S27E